MIPNEVCHYTKIDIALENILSEGRIRMSSFALVNDPKEFGWLNVPSIRLAGLNNEITDPSKKLHELNLEIDRVRTNEWKVLCVTLHRNSGREIRDVRKRHLKDKFRLGYSRPQMWAHYAGNNSGVCFLFDGKKLHHNIFRELKGLNIKHGKVNYGDKNSIGPYPINEGALNSDPIELARQYVDVNYCQLFLQKYPEWENETEFRWLVHSPDKSEEYVSIGDCIKEIFVGVNFQEVYEPFLRELCKKLKIPARKMVANYGLLSPGSDYIYKP